jgi:hypothetical protein
MFDKIVIKIKCLETSLNLFDENDKHSASGIVGEGGRINMWYTPCNLARIGH